jgi:hypothetical protein
MGELKAASMSSILVGMLAESLTLLVRTVAAIESLGFLNLVLLAELVNLMKVLMQPIGTNEARVIDAGTWR